MKLIFKSPSIFSFQGGTSKLFCGKEEKRKNRFAEPPPERRPLWAGGRTINTERFFRSKGFTLIEISIFIILLGIFMAGIMSPFLTSVMKSDRPELVASAVFLAAERLEQLQTSSYSAIASDPSPVALTGNYSAFSRQVVVTLVDASMAASGSDVGYKKVVVTVFNNRLPAAGISITSLFANFGG
jgi:type II secretory pathway pseudopilin PulG